MKQLEKARNHERMFKQLLLSLFGTLFFTTNVYSQTWEVIKGGRFSSNKMSLTGSKKSADMGGRSSFGAVSINEFIYVHGGWGLNRKGRCAVLNDIWQFDTRKRKWNCLAKNSLDSAYFSRSNHTLVHYNNELFSFFGVAYNKQNKKYTRSDVSVYNIETTKRDILELNNSESQPLSRHTPVTWQRGNKFYVLGGIHVDSLGRNHTLEDFWVFNLDEKTWRQLSQAKEDYCQPFLNVQQDDLVESEEYQQPNYIKGGLAWVYNGDLYYYISLAGESFINNAQIWKYYAQANKWKLVKVNRNNLGEYGELAMPGYRTSSVVWVDRNTLYLYGGFSYNSSRLYGLANDTWKLNLENLQWIKMSPEEDCKIYADIVYETEDKRFNNPGARIETAGLSVTQNNKTEQFLLAGLLAHNGKTAYRNDVWKLVPDQTEEETQKIREYQERTTRSTSLETNDCPLRILTNTSVSELQIVSSADVKNLTIQIYDLSGNLAAEYTEGYIQQGQTITMELSKLRDGDYIVQYVLGNSKKCSERIIVNNTAH